MGLLDGIAGQVLGSLGGSAGNQQSGLVQAIGGLIAQHPGGLAGLIADFERNGLGGVAASWVGTGANQPITPDQLQSVLGSEQLQSVAASSGVSSNDVSAGLAQLFPQVVDKLTPAGSVPDRDSLGALLGAIGR